MVLQSGFWFCFSSLGDPLTSPIRQFFANKEVDYIKIETVAAIESDSMEYPDTQEGHEEFQSELKKKKCKIDKIIRL